MQPAHFPAESAQQVILALSHWPHHPVAKALIRVDVHIKADVAIAGCLTLTAMPGPANPLRKNVELSPGGNLISVALNTHLLSNGPQMVEAVLLLDGLDPIIARCELVIDNTGPLAEAVRESLKRSSSPTIIDGSCDSTLFDYADSSVFPWFDRPGAEEHIMKRLQADQVSEAEATLLTKFVRDGFFIVPNLIDENHLANLNKALDEAIAEKWEGYRYGLSQRLQHLHKKHAAIEHLWLHPLILHLLSLIFEAPPAPCQTLTYIFGSQQRAHQDTIHLTPFPAGYMCGVWVALEDVSPGSGELFVYPGSHRLPRLYSRPQGVEKVTDGKFATNFREKVGDRWQTWIAEQGLQKHPYYPRRGDVLFWHENLLHGGSQRMDMLKSRRSIVSHYFAEGSVAYYDSSGQVAYLEYVAN